MKKKMKRIAAAAFSCLMLLGLIPITSQTVGAEESEDGEWEYEIDQITKKTVHITGYNGTDDAIIIPDTINGYTVSLIDNSTFYNYTNFKSIEIPADVTVIGSYVFEDCYNLNEIKIDSNNKNYASYDGALYNKEMTELLVCPAGKKSLTISNGVTTIDNDAFNGCINLNCIEISDSVTSIDEELFNQCSKLNKIEVDSNNKNYSSYEGALYNKDMTELIRCPVAKTQINMPDSLITIGNYAFAYCYNLSNLIIPEGIKEIGDLAFYGCSNLIEADIPNSVTSIGCSAFSYTQLSNITIPNSVNYIGAMAFGGCEHLTNIIIPNGVTEIDDDLFYNCSNLKSVEIPVSVTSIGEKAFSGCSSLENIEIPDGVTSIGDYAFYDCTKLESIEIPASVTSIGKYFVFDGCYNLSKIEVDSNNQSYASYDGALYNKEMTELIKCPAGKISINIPANMTTIDEWEFFECKKLNNITVDSDNQNYTSYDGALYNKEMTELIRCPGAKTQINIPDTVAAISQYSFVYWSSLNSIEVDINNQDYTSYDGALYNKEMTELIKCPKGKINLDIPDGVTSIGDFAFWNCMVDNRKIRIPDSVIKINSFPHSGNDTITIYGYTGSYAESYAESYDNILFKEYDSWVLQEIIFTGNTKSSINTREEDLYKAVFNDKELEQIENGANVSIELKINEISSDTDNTDKLAVETALPSGYKITNYFDITLTSKINETIRQITETSSAIEIAVEIPTETTGTYQVIRIHDGVAEILPTTIKDGKLVFSTDKFSTYAIIYKPALNDVEAGNNSMAICALLLAVMSVTAAEVIYLRKR